MRRLLPLSVLLFACSCITIELAGGSSDQTVYRLECPPPGAGPGGDLIIRVRDFSCSSEYDRTGMVLVDSAGVVTRASSHRWSSSPSTALSDLITRDLLMEGSFSAVYRRSVMEGENVILEGYVREFGARQLGAGWFAVIETDIILFEAPRGGVIVQRSLRLETPMSSTGFDELALTMSDLATVWSDSARTLIRESLESLDR